MRRGRSRHLWAAIGCGIVASGAGCSLVTSWDGLEATGSSVDAAGGADVDVDAAKHADAGPDARRCTAGVVSCGGHDVPGEPDGLYRCEADGSSVLVSRCMYGCIVNAPPTGTANGDSCAVCSAGGFYCGGDKIAGDMNILYVCEADGAPPSVKEICPNSCVVRPGLDDACK
ncbi:MAG: hypothetical protein ABIP39_14395 [Polyangiaceae bacterium]